MSQASIPSHTPADAPTIARAESLPSGVLAYIELTKPRITKLVAVTGGVGFALSSINRGLTVTELALGALTSIAGVSLAAAGANTLNQWWEWERDAKMPRTEGRPIPTGRITPRSAMWFGAGLALLGVLVLLVVAGLVPALLTLATVLLYTFVYTPLKPITTLATVVGAVPGALPPLIGWSAAAAMAGSGEHAVSILLDPGGVALFALMFVWQIPHFLAIAWIYRDDYSRGGYRTLPQVDGTGRGTATVMLLWTIGLIPIAIGCALAMPDRVSVFTALLAGVLSIGFLLTTIRLVMTRTVASMRLVFVASIIYLPTVMAGMIADAMVRVMV